MHGKIRNSLLAFVIVTSTSGLYAQTAPPRHSESQRAEFYVGGSYVHKSYSSTQDSSSAGAGFDSSLNLSLAPRMPSIGFKTDFSGIYGGGSQAYLLTFGPQFSHRFSRETVFVHALGGAAHLNQFSYFPLNSSLSVAAVLGGGIDTSINRRFAWRVTADYLYTNFIAAGAETNQLRLLGSNARIGGGLVYRF